MNSDKYRKSRNNRRYEKPKKRKADIKSIEGYFMYFIARRDYSIKELVTKGHQKYEDASDEIDTVINNYIQNGYIDEERMTESFVRMKFNDRYGEVRIKMDLKQKGINSELIFFELEKYDWFESAFNLKEQKYGEEIESDYKILQKQKNYLIRRGFSFDQVNYAFEPKD